MPFRYLTPANTYDRSAIVRAAWANARTLVVTLAKAPANFRRDATARALFGSCLTRVWDEARSERALAVWNAGQAQREAAEQAHVATLTAREREIEAAERAVFFAEMSDAVTSHVAISAARARLHSLHTAA